jgi:hypothetical protein
MILTIHIIMPRKRVRIVNIVQDDDAFYHCGNCCTSLCVYCDCELEKIPLYVEYDRKNKKGLYSKDYAYECLTCDSINKIL